jgi:hypothetical protein
MQTMSMSPQEQNLYMHHLNNLYGPGKVVHANGDVSTLYQAVVPGPGGLYYNIPTVWDGQILDRYSAQQRAAQAGWANWPGYATPQQADMRYEQMHMFIDRDTEQWLGSQR